MVRVYYFASILAGRAVWPIYVTFLYIKGISAPIDGFSVGISTSPIDSAWRLILAKKYII